MIKQLLYVGIGGGIGSIMRYLASVYMLRKYPFDYPLATFAVNITGCLLIGFLIGLSERYAFLDKDMKLLLVTGFCGGYTTFSTFSLENMRLLESHNYISMALYIILSVVVGIAATWFGHYLSAHLNN